MINNSLSRAKATGDDSPQWANTNTPPLNLTQSIALEESRLPSLFHTAASMIGCLMATFLIWSAFAKVEEIAQAAGQVIPSGYVQNVQHPDGGVVREILVQEGDLIEKDQPLIRLDDTNANADLGQMQARQQALQAQASRLRSYAGTTDKSLVDNLNPAEREILGSMEDARTQQINVLKDQISQKEKELSALLATKTALKQNVALKIEENNIYEETLARGSSSKLMALTSRRELNQLRGQLAEITSQENRARDAVQESKSRLQSLNADLKQQAMKELGQVDSELAELDKSIARQVGAAGRTTITAPVRGIVKGLTVHTIGAVIEPGKLIMEIVPVDKELMVEALVSPTDIGMVKNGQPVKIKVSAFDFSRYGSLPGTMDSISASTFQDEKGQFFYKAKVKLDKNYVGKTPGRNLVLPGMTVQADIVTGEKTVLQYLLKPVQTITDGAFHER